MEFSASNLELGRLYFERGDILKAIEVLEPLANSSIGAKQYSLYLDVLLLLLRAYAEHLDFDKIEKEKNRLIELTHSHGLQMTSKINYVLALCASYRNQHDEALAYSQESLSLALQENDKHTACYAIFGLAISYSNLDQLQKSLQEIYNLQVLMGALDIPQIRLSVNMLKARILRKMGKNEQSLEVLWQSYEVLKNYKNFYMQTSLFIAFALTYKQLGNIQAARNYVELAEKSIDVNNMKMLAVNVGELRAEVLKLQPESSRHDFVFNLSDHTVIERQKGRIDFGNQFILMDLLKLFVQQPGVSFSKEQLVKHIWKQSYNPAVHDNKIYVTIKRLRQLIEPDVEKPKYIFRSKNGYYLNKDISVLIESEHQRERI
jgi:DNA-binding winged helix-turn-helix (wHTH) protein